LKTGTPAPSPTSQSLTPLRRLIDPSAWPPSPEDISLRSGDVHVWRASLDVPSRRVHDLEQFLVAEEIARANRFYFRTDRDRWIVTRSTLRRILGRYLKVAPALLRFRSKSIAPSERDGEGRKPALEESCGGAWLRFNISHSDWIALIAITRDRDIGIDLERIVSDPSHETLAERLFSQEEAARVRGLPPGSRESEFFRYWVRKEAHAKATGNGLTLPLAELGATRTSGRPLPLPISLEGNQTVPGWSIVDLAAADGFAAAVVVQGRVSRLHCWEAP
jgi:4'-phosphopantetheinyl transferase